MKSYVKHVSRERARFRHPAFADPHVRGEALEILQKQAGIAGIRQGPESFLLFLEPEADLTAMCANLEEAVPEIRDQKPATAHSAGGRRKFSFRKNVLKTYLATGVTTVTLAALGLHHWHAFFGAIFTAFATNHVWDRRKAL